MGSEIVTRADFSAIRYAQCWEDADILLEALDVRPGKVCLSIASSGDNARGGSGSPAGEPGVRWAGSGPLPAPDSGPQVSG